MNNINVKVGFREVVIKNFTFLTQFNFLLNMDILKYQQVEPLLRNLELYIKMHLWY